MGLFKKKFEYYIRTLETYSKMEGKINVFDKLILNNNPLWKKHWMD